MISIWCKLVVNEAYPACRHPCDIGIEHITIVMWQVHPLLHEKFTFHICIRQLKDLMDFGYSAAAAAWPARVHGIRVCDIVHGQLVH